jgi:hypothetical protein
LSDRAQPAKTLDEKARELTGGKVRSPQAVKLDQALNRYERGQQRELRSNVLKSSWNREGDVYLSLQALDAMRKQGNWYLQTHRGLDRKIERALEREFGNDRSHRTIDERLREFKQRAQDIAKSLSERAVTPRNVQQPPAARERTLNVIETRWTESSDKVGRISSVWNVQTKLLRYQGTPEQLRAIARSLSAERTTVRRRRDENERGR